MSRQKKLAECVFHAGFVTTTIDPEVHELWKGGLGVARVPFGDLRTMWRRHHCRKLNPYGDSERCPYPEKDCAYAFLDAVRTTVQARPRVPVGYFIAVAKRTAAIRADDAVAQRASARLARTSVQPVAEPFPRDAQVGPFPDTNLDAPSSPQGAPPHPRRLGSAVRTSDPARRPGDLGVGAGDGSHPDRDPQRRAYPSDIGPDRGLPGRGDGPVDIGELLRRVAPRPRQGRDADGEEGRG